MKFFQEFTTFDRITFVEKTHSYLIDGLPTNSPSVTRLLKRYKKEFDKEKAAYRVAKKQRTTVAHILAEWEMNNLYSTTLGTMVHKYVENFYNNKRNEFDGNFNNLGFEEKKKLSETLPKLIDYFQNFYNDNKHLVCIKSEMVLGDVEDTKVCGMMDMLSFNTHSNMFEILDFKTNKKMDKTSPWGNLYYPFDDMTEGEINEYTIQLNCYKYFLEKYTSCKIDKLKLIWLNTNNSNYEIIELVNLQDKIKLMMDAFTTSSLFGKK